MTCPLVSAALLFVFWDYSRLVRHSMNDKAERSLKDHTRANKALLNSQYN